MARIKLSNLPISVHRLETMISTGNSRFLSGKKSLTTTRRLLVSIQMDSTYVPVTIHQTYSPGIHRNVRFGLKRTLPALLAHAGRLNGTDEIQPSSMAMNTQARP